MPEKGLFFGQSLIKHVASRHLSGSGGLHPSHCHGVVTLSRSLITRQNIRPPQACHGRSGRVPRSIASAPVQALIVFAGNGGNSGNNGGFLGVSGVSTPATAAATQATPSKVSSSARHARQRITAGRRHASAPVASSAPERMPSDTT